MGKNKTPLYRKSHLKKQRRETPRNEPQKNQTKFKIACSGNKYADRMVEVSPKGCRISTEAPLKVGDVIAG